MKFGLKQRLSPPDFKELTQGLSIQQLPLPEEVILPLAQDAGTAAEAKVTPGDKVKTATRIAEAVGYVSAPIHSSLSGEVSNIETRPHPLLGEDRAIVIKSDGSDILDEAVQRRPQPPSFSREQILQIIRDCGVVGLGGAAFPTHVKLKPPKEKHIDSFILNGAECEPYITADERLMLEKPGEIVAGMEVAMQVLKVASGYVAIEENKPEALDLFRKEVSGKNIKVVTLSSFYPQGAEKQLIRTLLGREVPPGGLPFDVGVVVNNVATCFAIYEAVYRTKPLYERVITVTGSIVKRPANLMVRIGTKVKDIIEFCGGLTEEPAKVVLGGPMMGIAQYTLDVPIIKGTSGIIVFSKKEAKAARPAKASCIRCARCMQVCPMGLHPQALAQAIEKGNFDLAKEYHVLDCIECGICSYACPGNRDIVGLVKLAKQKLKK